MKNKLSVILFTAVVSIASTHTYGADFTHGCPAPANVENSRRGHTKGEYTFNSNEEYSKGNWTVKNGGTKVDQLVSAAWVRYGEQAQLTCTYNGFTILKADVLGAK